MAEPGAIYPALSDANAFSTGIQVFNVGGGGNEIISHHEQAVDRFLHAHTGQARDRRPIFAITGGTQTGKSLLGAWVLGKLAELHDLPGFLEITVEDDEHFDMSECRVDKHAGVLLDGVGDARILNRQRETLQGHPKPIKGGRSATMMYSYTYTLCRRGVVATFDLSASNLHLFKTDHWLSDPRNVIQLHLTSPAWETGVAASSHTQPHDEPHGPDAFMDGL